MSPEGLETWSHIVIAVGFVLNAAGAFGAFYCRKSNRTRLQTWSHIGAFVGIVTIGGAGFAAFQFGSQAEVLRQKPLQENIDELLTRSETLEEKLEPFVELARNARPDLDQDAALENLRQEIEELRNIAAKHEFTPLSAELRAAFINQIRRISVAFAKEEMTVQITHETWSPPTVREYAGQLATLLKDGGLRVRGPTQITYFLVTPSSPIEWGYNEADLDRVELLYQAFLTIVHPNPHWTTASHQKPGSIRIHFGGEMNFEPNGIVKVL